jgi:Protein of unknown function (DUF3570)
MQSTRSRMPGRQSLASSGVALLLQLMLSGRARSENQAGFQYESYSEENDRIQVETYSFFAVQAINSRLSLQAELVYDSISGATPTGGPPPVGSNQVPTMEMNDIRRAGNLVANLNLANHTLAPQIAYSKESDYESIGIALTDAIDFNEKNTTLVLGLSHDFDTVEPSFWPTGKNKDTTAALLGVNQLLDPKTVLSVDLTLGYADGYLADPYRGVRFDGYPDPNSLFPEKRPGHKTSVIGFTSLTHFFDAVNGSAELSNRLYYDSYHIFANTVTVQWSQKIGKHVVLAPLFRYYTQSEAYFYGVRFPGDPSDPTSTVPIPKYYSADYRLTALTTYTYGAQLTFIITDWLSIYGGYSRYEMMGDNSQTPASAYPKANVFNGGLQVQW